MNANPAPTASGMDVSNAANGKRERNRLELLSGTSDNRPPLLPLVALNEHPQRADSDPCRQ